MKVGLTLVNVLSINDDLRPGLFYVSCVPGGGMGYLSAVLTTDRSQTTSTAISFVCNCLVLGKLFQRIYLVLGEPFQRAYLVLCKPFQRTYLAEVGSR